MYLDPTRPINLTFDLDIDELEAEGIHLDDIMVIHTASADPEDVAYVLAGDPIADHTRSQWLWFRLPNGDLVLGVFPQGETYMGVTDKVAEQMRQVPAPRSMRERLGAAGFAPANSLHEEYVRTDDVYVTQAKLSPDETWLFRVTNTSVPPEDNLAAPVHFRLTEDGDLLTSNRIDEDTVRATYPDLVNPEPKEG